MTAPAGGHRGHPGGQAGQTPRQEGGNNDPVRLEGGVGIVADRQERGRNAHDRSGAGRDAGRMSVAPRVRIKAEVPLLRAGLERLAGDAALRVVADGNAEMTLRSADQAADDAPFDVTITEGGVVIVCRRAPDRETWEALRRLVHSAFGC